MPAELLVRARGRAEGGAAGSPAWRSSEGATSPSRMDWRLARGPLGPARAASRSDLKVGPVGDAALVRRQVRRGS